MKYRHPILLCLLIMLAPFVKIHAQDSSSAYRVVKSSNGQSFVLNTHGTGSTIYTDIYFRIGPIYEFDSLSGISMIISKVINSQIKAELKAAGKQIKYYGTVEPEQIGFHFESGLADLEYIASLANEKIVNSKFDDNGLDEAKTEIRTDIDSISSDSKHKRESTIMRTLWGNDYNKLDPFGDQQTYLKIKVEDLLAFHKRYFLPFNNTVCILGEYPDKEVLNKFLDAFKDFKSRDFNPELITKVIDFKPVINTIQFLWTGPDKSTATITYQNPGARQDRDATYAAYILTELINDKDGRIQKSLQQAGLRDVKAVYTCNNFYGTFTLSAQPSGSNFVDAFDHLSHLFTAISQKNYFKEGEVEKAKKNIGIEYSELKSNNIKGYMSLVERYRFSNDENYFTSLPDSINNVSIEHMYRYIDNYFTDHTGVRSLVTSPDALKAAPAGQQYFALDPSVADITFTYDLNKTDIETDSAKYKLKRLIQWLTINPDVHVQINGFADEGEFIKSYDDSVLRFIDSTATFHKAMPDATRKGYLRIEFMRAMKIAKALYEAGITEDRITGTSMVFSSDTKEAAALNRKCTITLEDIKPHISLYEYHFGKKKENPDAGNR